MKIFIGFTGRKMIKISVIIPVYNQMKQLKYVLDYFERQIGIDTRIFEIIIIDDGSDEKIIDLSKYSNKILYKKFENRGRAKARNKGFEYSSGEFLIFSDADRIPNSTFILKHYNLIKKYNSSIFVGYAYDFYGNQKN